MSDAALNLRGAQTGDVTADSIAGGDVVHQGVDAEQVVELLGERLERQLAQLVTVTSRGVIVTALLVFAHIVALLLWGTTVYLLMQPYLVAGL